MSCPPSAPQRLVTAWPLALADRSKALGTNGLPINQLQDKLVQCQISSDFLRSFELNKTTTV